MSLPPSIILDLLVLLIPLSHHSNYKEEERREKKKKKREERREKKKEEERRKKKEKEERRKKKEERRKKKSTQYGTVHKALIHNFLKQLVIIILFIIYLLESHVSVHPIPLLRIPIPRFLIISTI